MRPLPGLVRTSGCVSATCSATMSVTLTSRANSFLNFPSFPRLFSTQSVQMMSRYSRFSGRPCWRAQAWKVSQLSGDRRSAGGCTSQKASYEPRSPVKVQRVST